MEIGLLTRIDLLVTREPEKRIFQPKKNTNLSKKDVISHKQIYTSFIQSFSHYFSFNIFLIKFFNII